MTLTLTVLRCPDRVPPQTKRLEGGEFSIGRGSENDWVLPDPDRHLSKKHCVVAYRAGHWRLLDTSANGTFLNHDLDPLGQGADRDLRNGDRMRLGPYEIEVGIVERASGPAAPPSDFFAPEPVFYHPTSARLNPFDNSEAGGPHALLPADFDPLAPEADSDDFAGAVQPDHSAALEAAFDPRPPLAAPPEKKLIPDDWDLDLAPQPAPPELVAVTPPPPPPPPPPQIATAPLPPSVSDSELLAAFLDGACIEGATPGNPEATMRAVGRTFRALVSGLRQAMVARAEIKGEFRIERTMIRARGNNPLKFSADDDDALAALLGTGRVTDVDPARAVTEAMHDIRLHELASVTAMQAGVRALLGQFSPAALRTKADEAGGIALVPAQRKARAWDMFEKLYNETSRALDDDFDSVFGRAFARAYEQALRELGGADDA